MRSLRIGAGGGHAAIRVTRALTLVWMIKNPMRCHKGLETYTSNFN